MRERDMVSQGRSPEVGPAGAAQRQCWAELVHRRTERTAPCFLHRPCASPLRSKQTNNLIIDELIFAIHFHVVVAGAWKDAVFYHVPGKNRVGSLVEIEYAVLRPADQ